MSPAKTQRPQGKSPFHPPLAKGERGGILAKWRPAEAVQAWHENDLKHLKLKRKEFAQAAQNFNCSSTKDPSLRSGQAWNFER
jgi:hypothetical protein